MSFSNNPMASLFEDNNQANDDQYDCSELVTVKESNDWQNPHMPQVEHTELESDCDSLFDDNESIGSEPAIDQESEEVEIGGEMTAPVDDSADADLEQAMWDELNRSDNSDAEESDDDSLFGDGEELRPAASSPAAVSAAPIAEQADEVEDAQPERASADESDDDGDSLFGEPIEPEVQQEKPVIPKLAPQMGLALPRKAAPKTTEALASTPAVPAPISRQRANSDDVFAPSPAPSAGASHASGLALPKMPILKPSTPMSSTPAAPAQAPEQRANASVKSSPTATSTTSPASTPSTEPIWRRPTPPTPTPAPRKRAPKRRYEAEMEARNEQARISGAWHDAQRKKARMDPQVIATEQKHRAEVAATAAKAKAELDIRLAKEKADREANRAARGPNQAEFKDNRWRQPKDLNDPAQRKEWLNEDGTFKVLTESDELAAMQCQEENVWETSKAEKHARKMEKQREARAMKEMFAAQPVNRNLLAEFEAANQKAEKLRRRMEEESSDADCDGETDDEFVSTTGTATPSVDEDDDVMIVEAPQVHSHKGRSTMPALKRKDTSSAGLAQRWARRAAEAKTNTARKDSRLQTEEPWKGLGGSREMAMVID